MKTKHQLKNDIWKLLETMCYFTPYACIPGDDKYWDTRPPRHYADCYLNMDYDDLRSFIHEGLRKEDFSMDYLNGVQDALRHYHDEIQHNKVRIMQEIEKLVNKEVQTTHPLDPVK